MKTIEFYNELTFNCLEKAIAKMNANATGDVRAVYICVNDARKTWSA